jgi:RNA polymerase sigma-70 factor (ECF subfamily)
MRTAGERLGRPPDEETIARVRRGETDAFGEVFVRHYAGVRSYLARAVARDGDADDLVVEVFVRAFRRIGSLDGRSDGSFAAYLYTIARNVARDAGRRRAAWGGRRATARLPEAASELATERTGTEDAVLREEAGARIRSALRLLPEDDRHVLVLSYQQDLSARDIMAVLGKPSEAAVRAHVYRALKRLRDIVQRDGYFSEHLAPPEEGE